MQPLANIAVWNAAQTPLGFDLKEFVHIMQLYVDHMMVPIWGRPAKLTLSDGPIAGQWGMIFMDDADSPGALAYHTVQDGLPLAKVFVRTVLQNGELVTTAATHELAEMLVDPSCSIMVLAPNGSYYSFEACDPVEENSFDIMGWPLSDFVFPNYFDASTDGKGHQYSFTRAITHPFALAPGGYQSIYSNGQWSEIFGSRTKARAFAKEDRRGHRSEFRRLTAPI